MRDQTRKVMKAQLQAINDQIDRSQAEIDFATQQLAQAKTMRDDLKAERDLIKADLDAEPEGTPQKRSTSKAKAKA